MNKLLKNKYGSDILFSGEQKFCPYDATIMCGSACAMFENRPAYKLENGGQMNASVFLWCCNRNIELDKEPTK